MSVEIEKKGRNPHVNKGEKDKSLQRISTIANAPGFCLGG